MSPKLLNILLAALSFVLYYVVISPLWTGTGSVWSPENGVAALRASEMNYQDTVNQAQNLFNQGKELRSQYEAVDADAKAKMNVMVPAKIDQIGLLSEVDAIASQSGIALSNVTAIEGVSADKDRGVYDIGFTVNTNYGKFKDFMRNYETSLRLFTLQSVTFDAPDKPDDLIKFKVVLRTYYLK